MEPTQYPWYSTYPLHSYPSPTPSDPSPPLEYAALAVQIDSNIGPTRPMRRKQRVDVLCVEPDRYAGSALDSPYRPSTPSSMASPYAPYDYARRSRTRSDSVFEPRPPSPTLSSASAHTSHSNEQPPPRSGPVRTHKEKHTKHRLRDCDRKNICLHHLKHPNARQEDIGAFFGVERSTISKILKDKDKWLHISSEDEHNEQTAKHRPSKFPEIEEAMHKSLQNWSDTGTNITDQLIRQRALEIAKSFHISTDRFKGSSGWVENFKGRHDIRRGEWLRAQKNSPQQQSFNLPAPPPAAAHVPPTPVILAYDQRIEATNSSESSSSTEHSQASAAHHPQEQQHQLPPEHWTNQPPHHPPQNHHLVLDPALQDASVSHHHILHHAIQHSPLQPSFDYSQQQLHGPGVLPPLQTFATTSPIPHHCENPTLEEAEEAINTVITFISTKAPDLLKDDERMTLTHIKCALFQFASGIPYDRGQS